MIYLDYAAATPLDSDVLSAMQPFFSTHFHNPSALYGPALEVSGALEGARAKVASIIGAKSPEIIFTAGGTEANNIAIHGIMSQYDGEVLYSAIEHDSVRGPAQQYISREIAVDEQGMVIPGNVEQNITDKTVLVSVMYANNEVGTVQPVKRIAQQIEAVRKDRQFKGNQLPIYLHVDAAQAGNYLDLHVHRLGIDLMTLNGGKIYGPKQSGALFVRTGITLKSPIQGGGQERNIRSGTENVAAVVGFAAALEKADKLRHEESKRVGELRDQFIKGLQQQFPEVIINGSQKYRLPNNLHITLPGLDNERLLMALDMEGIYAAAGSACSASHEEPSHVLQAMGCSENHIRSSIRFSLGRQTTAEDIIQTLQLLTQLAK